MLTCAAYLVVLKPTIQSCQSVGVQTDVRRMSAPPATTVDHKVLLLAQHDRI